MNWAEVKPFPHRVIDNLIDLQSVRAVNAEWPERGWGSHIHDYSNKRANEDWETFGPMTRNVLSLFKSAVYLDCFKALTGISDLSPDPYLFGEGLHESTTGGFLDIHVDFNVHPKTELYRRLNLLIFLNEGWQEEWGGCLELWDGATAKLSKRIVPEAGRAIIFETSERSFHGHPVPVNTDRPRRSLALYYYSAEPASRTGKHSTLYVEKGQI